MLDELLGVTQGTQTRSFVYDSLKRLKQATNPESGTASYSYDGVGNLLTRTDNRGIQTSYSYDALNRLSQRSYQNDPVGTQTVQYSYDTDGTLNSKGRLTKVDEGWVTTNYTGYDELGRVKGSNEQLAGYTYSFNYTYNLAGALTGEQYPSQRMIYTCYDGANRVTSVSAASGCHQVVTADYVSNVSYWPHGAPYVYWYKNLLGTVAYYNNRLQPITQYANIGGAQDGFLFQQEFCWTAEACPNSNVDNVGNLGSIHTLAGGPDVLANLAVFDQSFAYDGVNRLTMASDTGGWTRGFQYDPVGNMWVDPARTTGIPLAGNTPTSNVYNGNNQISGSSYDLAGNQLVVNGDTMTYDAENRQIQVNETPGMGGGQLNYGYDGDGQRVMKIVAGGASTVYVYDAFGQLAAEYSSGPAQLAPCQTCYLTYDHLGSVRLVTDENANVVARHDYLPFGEEIPGGSVGRSAQFGAADAVSQRFTEQERDNETGLDFFQTRYYGAALGRFTSADAPLVDQFEENPQSWSLYSYVRNNPLRNVDPTGNACVYSGSGSLNDPSNYSDDDSGGQSCSDAFSSQQDSQPSATVYGQGGNQLVAFGLNLGFELSNFANSYFSFIAPNSQLLSQTPPNQEFTGLLAMGVAIAGTVLIGPEGEAGNLLKITEAQLTKVLQTHTEGGLLSGGKSLFNAGVDVKNLIQAAAFQSAIPQAGGNFERIVDAGRIVGIDRNTGRSTSVYTVITDRSGKLITAFPGRP